MANRRAEIDPAILFAEEMSAGRPPSSEPFLTIEPSGPADLARRLQPRQAKHGKAEIAETIEWFALPHLD
jgi:hypothetical protein